jgi:hypothetical protein
MESSSAPWGLAIENWFYGAVTDTGGGQTQIVNSQVGTQPLGTPGAMGLVILGDDGPNTVTIKDTKEGGAAVINLGDQWLPAPVVGPPNGVDVVNISSDALPNTQRTSFGSLTINTGSGNDQVGLSMVDVATATVINTWGGQDAVNIDYQKTGTVAAPLSRLMGTTTINCGSPGPTFGTPETDLVEYAPGVVFGTGPTIVSANVVVG